MAAPHPEGCAAPPTVWLALLAALLVACAGGSDAVPVDGGPVVDGGGCLEGTLICEGFDELICRAGLYEATGSDNCAAEACEGENCMAACLSAARNKSYLGCEYWAVDLDNAVEVLGPAAGPCAEGQTLRQDLDVCTAQGADGPVAWLCEVDGTCGETPVPCQRAPVCVLDAQRSPFAVVVANPSETDPVTVGLEGPGGEAHFQQVAPGAVAEIFPAELGFADWSVDHTSQSRRAYKLTSTEPIVAYQFNPLDNVGVFSNDGSLLIPAHAYDTVYYAMTQPTLDRSPIHDYSGYIAIVASAEGATEVSVLPFVAVRAGPELPSLPAGVNHRFTLQQGDVLNLEAVGGADLTGTRIEAVDGETPFGVFVGHEAVLLSDLLPAPCCADHIEEQLFPASTWGLRFAIARSEPRTELRRGEPVADMLRIIALEAETEIRLDPPARDRAGAAVDVCRIGAGQVCDDLFVDGDTLVIASKPILVGQFLLSAGGQGGNPVGDPAMAFAPPLEQFRDSYAFLAPDAYDQQFAAIVAPAGAAVTLDGRRIEDSLLPFAGAFAAGRMPISPGQHRLECDGGCGLLVHGYSPAVSYLFAGGLDLRRITVP